MKSLPNDIMAAIETAEDKLKSARILLEARQYSDAASRAYYCAFHSVCAVLLSRNLSFSSHRQTLGTFNREFVKSGHFPTYFGHRLIKMQADREAGDYRTSSPIGDKIAAEDVEFAQEILSARRNYLEVFFNDEKDVASPSLS